MSRLLLALALLGVVLPAQAQTRMTAVDAITPFGNVRFGDSVNLAVRVVFIDPGTGDRAVFAPDATTATTASTSGPQGMFYYRGSLSGTALVGTGQAIRAASDGMGRGYDGGRCDSLNIIDGQATITDGSSTSVMAAAGTSIINEVWEVDLGNTSASNITVDLRDGTGGAVLRTFTIPAGGAISRPLTIPIRTSANTAMAADPSAAATSIIISLAGCTVR